MACRLSPRPVLALIGRLIVLQQALLPGKPVGLPFLLEESRIMIRCASQFDSNFARAFVDGSAGEWFDHAVTLSRIDSRCVFCTPII